jgi:tripartite-type tricarboxylate transporter receptor subunit TctC
LRTVYHRGLLHRKFILKFTHYVICASLLAAGAACAQPGSPQVYPNRALRLVAPSTAGGGVDMAARIVAPRLAERLGQQVVIENRAGAGSVIGTDSVAKAAPDGYTLLMAISTLATNPVLYRKMPYDTLRDFVPVTQVAALPNMLIVHPSMPVKTAREFVAFVRARQGQINFGSPGTGTNPHLAIELFRSQLKLDMTHVPYKGSAPAIIDIIAGHFPVMMGTIITTVPHVRTGRVRALGVTGAKRSPAAPDVPTIAESVLPGYEAVQWYGVVAPVKTPAEIIARLHTELVQVLQLIDIKEKFGRDGAETVGSTPDEFSRFIRAELEKWRKAGSDAGIKPE